MVILLVNSTNHFREKKPPKKSNKLFLEIEVEEALLNTFYKTSIIPKLKEGITTKL